MKSAAELAVEELRVIDREAGLGAVREALERNVPFFGYEDGKRFQYFAEGGKRIVDEPAH